jgi:hypothetical protein
MSHDSSIMLLTICSKCILKDNWTLFLLFPKAAKIEILPTAGFCFLWYDTVNHFALTCVCYSKTTLIVKPVAPNVTPYKA